MSKEEMAAKAAEIICRLPYEDAEFVCKFLASLEQKRGRIVSASGN